jgi:hypothetical protein
MSVVAKVKLSSKTTTEYGAGTGQVQLNFQAVYGDENKEWAEATPNLNLSMTVKAEVGERFNFDKPYFLTFEQETE